jgi:predicted enzyme related to lactoylglutathione lyase
MVTVIDRGASRPRRKDPQMLRGLTTVSFFADDLDAAKKWYTELLGIDPYFERPVAGPPAYIEFRLGDYHHELGVIDSRYAPHGSAPDPAGVVVFWHVDDVTATLEKLLSMGAKEHQTPIDRGEGFITASVVDPFGNILGIMYNPHYLEVLAHQTSVTPHPPDHRLVSHDDPQRGSPPSRPS